MTIKKSLIAIAVSSAFVVPMTAQAEVYGRVNLNLVSSNDDANAPNNGTIDMQQTTSHFGFRGDEDLGNGLSALYRYEINIDPTDGTVPGSSRLSFVGLSGDFGTIKAGKMYGTFYNHVGVVTDLGWLRSSPAYYSLNADPTGFDPGYQLREDHTLQYTNSAGPFSFGIEGQFEGGDTPDADGDEETLDRVSVSGQFDAGVATFGLGHWSQSNATGPEPSSTGVSAIVPVGPGDIRASYVALDLDDDSDSDSPSALDVLGTMSFGEGWYSHVGVSMYDRDQADDEDSFTSVWAMVSKSLSSRTSVYAEFESRSVDGGDNADDTDPRWFNVGINHNF